LIRIDAASGNAQLIGQFPAPYWLIGGLAFDAKSDILYGINDAGTATSGASTLVVIDTTTAAVTTIGDPGLGLGLYDVDSLAFNPMDQMLYAINDGGQGGGPHQQQLVRIDPTTGVASLVGAPSGNVEFYQGLAIVPEPSSIAIMICALLFSHACRGTRRLRSHC
jgi:hypothetical protein